MSSPTLVPLVTACVFLLLHVSLDHNKKKNLSHLKPGSHRDCFSALNATFFDVFFFFLCVHTRVLDTAEALNESADSLPDSRWRLSEYPGSQGGTAQHSISDTTRVDKRQRL